MLCRIQDLALALRLHCSLRLPRGPAFGMLSGCPTGDEVLTNESVSKSGELVKAKWFMLDATELLDQWPEASSRVRALYDIDAAIDICCRAEQKDVLIQAKARGLKVFATSAAAREATPLDA